MDKQVKLFKMGHYVLAVIFKDYVLVVVHGSRNGTGNVRFKFVEQYFDI
jgi:hypothetical protein